MTGITLWGLRVTGITSGCQRRWGAAFVVLTLCGPAAFALDPAKAVTQYMHDVWQTDQGLPQNAVQAICQTRDGYLWLGTQEGLVRFDGVRFAVFDKSNTPELTQNSISALREDREGSLWIGQRGGGLTRLRDGNFKTFTAREGLSGDRVRSIYEDREGNLWIGTSGGGLTRLKDGKFTVFTTKDGLTNDQIVSIYEDREGSLWIGTFGGGLNRYREGRFTGFGTREGLSHDQVSSIIEDREGDLWIGTFGGGLNRYRDGRFTAFTTRQGLSNDQVWSILEDQDGSLWIGTFEGLNRFRDGSFAALVAKQGLSNDAVLSIYQDRERSLWIGTSGGGLNRLRDGKFTSFTTREGLSNDVALSIYEDRNGSVWIGTDGGGLSRFRDGRFTSFTTKDGLSNDHVVSIHEDREGSLWIGTVGGGVNRLRHGRITAFTTKQGLSDDIVYAIYEDHAGNLWMGTDGGGLNRFRDGKFTAFTTKNGLSHDRVVSIQEDRDENLWIGTSGGGLNRFRDGEFTAFTTKEGLSDDRITSVYEDAQGTLWIGTSGGGLNRFKDGSFTAFTTKVGLYDDRVFAILEDGQGNLWMSCNRGIFRASKKELNAFADGKLAKISSASYGTADGMRSAECNGENQPAGWKTRDGRLWFPTIKGVVVIDPAHIPINPLPPPVALEGVTADGKPVGGHPGSSFVIGPGNRKLDLQYTALSLVAPQRVKFRYRLEGFDKDWIEAGTDRTAHYTNLSPGDYTFRVKASNNDGIWNESGAALGLRLLPFFHQTRAFQVLCGLGVVLLGSGAHRLRMRRLKRRAEELERVVEEQTRDLRVANEDLQHAQEQLARLSEATPEKLENVGAWGTSMAEEIRRAIRAERVQIWQAEGESLVALTPNAGQPPAWEAVQAARTLFGSEGGATIVPVTGMTSEIRGALVIDGPVVWGETELRLVTGLAQHLGSALDLQALRKQLTVSASRQAEVRQRMLEQGIPTLKLCGRCGRCYDQTAEQCGTDGSGLDGSRLLPHRVLGRYRLTTLLGEGGMGSVFAAHDEKLQRDVALKVIRAERLSDAEARFRLEREARALARVHHPSVVELFDEGELEDGSAFLVMELLTGRDLADVLLKHGRGTPAQVGTLLRQVGPALGAAHRVGVIHRDVKPANILLTPDKETFQTKVLDFGLAKSTRSEARLTQTGVLVGTPAYMSPEQVEGREVDGRTDIYSLAAVAYEALTGRRVVEGQEVGRMLVDVLYAAPPRVSSLMSVPPEVDEAFEKALAKRAGDRPTAIESWAEDLAASLEAVRGGDATGWPVHLLRTRGKRPAPKGDDAAPGTAEF